MHDTCPAILSRHEFEIATGVKNTDWQKLRLTLTSSKEDWEAGVTMFEKRVRRFLEPVRVLMMASEIEVRIYAGFAIMALDCLLVETLQSFRIGRSNPLKGNDGYSTQAF